jgi:hypothetical protein
MHSGKFETWVRNTLYNMANIGIMYKWRHLVLAIFTGDDSALRGLHIEFDYASDWLKKNGLHLKDEKSPYFEVAGKVLIHNHALVPEPLRRTVKFITKMSHDLNHYNETIKSLRGGFEMYRCQNNIDEAAKVISELHNHHAKFSYKITPNDITQIMGFLYHEAINPRMYKQLTFVNKEYHMFSY